MDVANSPNINMKYSDLFLLPAGTIRKPLLTRELGSWAAFIVLWDGGTSWPFWLLWFGPALAEELRV